MQTVKTTNICLIVALRRIYEYLSCTTMVRIKARGNRTGSGTNPAVRRLRLSLPKYFGKGSRMNWI